MEEVMIQELVAHMQQPEVEVQEQKETHHQDLQLVEMVEQVLLLQIQFSVQQLQVTELQDQFLVQDILVVVEEVEVVLLRLMDHRLQVVEPEQVVEEQVVVNQLQLEQEQQEL